MPLKNMDFPLDVKVCFRPSLVNDSVLKKFGYEDLYHYILGLTAKNDSSALIGWGGNQSVRVKNASEVLFAAKNELPKSQALSYFKIWPKPGLKNLTATLQRINWISDCYLMNMDMVGRNDLRSIRTLTAMFNDSILQEHNVTVEVKLQGRNLAARRDMQDHIFYHTGDVMRPGKSFGTFRVKIKKRVFIEGEPGTSCRNYPNSDFESFFLFYYYYP